MFTIRPYRPEDAMGCGECFYEGFFSCPIDANDRAFLRDYGQVLVEKCNFTYVAVTREQQVVGFISGKYSKGFSKALASRCDTTRHYGAWVRMFLKFYLRGYKLSAAFQKQFEAFFQQARERDNRDFRDCDLELVPSTASFSPVCASTSSPGRSLSMGQRSTRPSGSTFQAFSSSTESIFLMEERVRSMV